jgi:hypothetical protein
MGDLRKQVPVAAPESATPRPSEGKLAPASTSAPSSRAQGRPLFQIEGFRLKIWPIIVTIFLGLFIPLLGAVTVLVAQHFNMLVERPSMPWVNYYYQHIAQLIFTLLFVLFFKMFLRADYGFHRPAGKSYVPSAIVWGILFGVVMTVVDWWPQIAVHKPPPGAYDLNTLNVAGWLSFEGLFSGTSEEPLFRGLLVTFLLATMPGRARLGRYEMGMGGVIAAFIFALAHFGSFFISPFFQAAGQSVYAFALGVLYAFWFEKSKSLLAPIVGHNISNLVEYLLIFAMVAYWH